jgi:TPR repeat protein
LPDAASFSKLSAVQGDAAGQYRYGRSAAKGIGIEQNLTKAAKWYKRAADRKNANAAFRFGEFLENGIGVR